MSNQLRKIAIRRLKRDLLELEQEGLLSISAKPLDNNIFEWHVNIKPTDGVYSGVYFHLIMTFPKSYPTNPPKVKICTPISHPNVFGSFICLSMLRPHTGNVPYEGWSGAYSVTSILMQLQSFLFAKKIDQDEGYQLFIRLSDYDINHSIKICKSFKCNGRNGCGHSHSTPWPKVKGPPEAFIKIVPIDPKSKHVIVTGSSCQTKRKSWVGARSDFGCNNGKIFYEASVKWSGGKKNGVDVGLCHFGFGSKDASDRLGDGESFGYDATGIFSYNDDWQIFGESFTKGDIITVAVDFDTKRIYFAKNGTIQEPNTIRYIPKHLQGKLLYPMLSLRSSSAEFNFGKARKPCEWLIDQGFKTLEQVAKEQGNFDDKRQDDEEKNDDNKMVDWHSYMIIDELWLSIFESLGVSEVYGAQFVCKQWYKIINKYNIIDRHQICCYYTKAKMGQGEGKILGIGLNITKTAKGHGFDVHSQMDILSLNAWINGCRIGVWGEKLTHFLPLPMNKSHSKIAHNWIMEYLQKLSTVVNTQNQYANTGSDSIDPLQLVDTLITMMNIIVVQFSMGNEHTNSSKVSMVICEKVVLGYCALHHLLLYLISKNSKIIHNYANKKVSDFINKPNGCTKRICKDLGKFLIYLLISPKYSWIDVADIFVEEAFTRQVRWMVKDKKYEKYDTTKQIPGRIQDTFTATEISRRLIMFQVWFMQNNANETLKGYNDRLGRPKISVKLGIVAKTKEIINSTRYYEFFDSLGCDLQNPIKEMDQLLRFAVWDSKQKGYHRHRGIRRHIYGRVILPKIIVNGRRKNGCGHSRSTKWCLLQEPQKSTSKIIPTGPKSQYVVVSGSGCLTRHTSWVGARGDFGCNDGKVFYEAFINWIGKKDGIDVGLCRFGFGSTDASDLLCDGESFGYDGSGIFSYDDQFTKFGESFTKGDTITVAVDFDRKRIYFAKNGKIQGSNIKNYIPKYLQNKLLFPMLSFKNSSVEFNFGKAKRPCKWLIDKGFTSVKKDSFDCKGKESQTPNRGNHNDDNGRQSAQRKRNKWDTRTNNSDNNNNGRVDGLSGAQRRRLRKINMKQQQGQSRRGNNNKRQQQIARKILPQTRVQQTPNNGRTQQQPRSGNNNNGGQESPTPPQSQSQSQSQKQSGIVNAWGGREGGGGGSGRGRGRRRGITSNNGGGRGTGRGGNDWGQSRQSQQLQTHSQHRQLQQPGGGIRPCPTLNISSTRHLQPLSRFDVVKQYYVAVEKEDYKLATLFDLYQSLTIKKAIIFVNSQRKLIWIHNKMSENNFSVSLIDSECSYKQKELIIKQFENGLTKILLLNDPLLLDIYVPLVINYDLPENKELYIDRVGGSDGRRYAKKYVINFVPDCQEEKLRDIEAFYNVSIDELPQDVTCISIAGDVSSISNNNNTNDEKERDANNDWTQSNPPQQMQQENNNDRYEQQGQASSGSNNNGYVDGLSKAKKRRMRKKNKNNN